MNTSDRRQGFSPFYVTAALLAFLGLMGTFVSAWFVGMILSAASLGLVAAGRWIRHEPLEGTAWAAVVIGLVGLAAQVSILVFLTPTAAVVG